MRWNGKFRWGSSAWHWATAATLVLALAGAQAASAASTGSATIIIFAPGAPVGAQVRVEWLDPTTGVWDPVAGWTGTLNQTTVSGVPFQGFAVLPANYGQEPFRWVVLNPASSMAANNSSTTSTTATGSSTTNMTANNSSTASTTASSVWGTSSPFALPNTDGVHLDITVQASQILKTTNTVIPTTSGPSTAPAKNPLFVTTLSTMIMSLNCPTGGCNAGAITGKFTGLPSTSWITVEWLDSSGLWQPVMGWQGQADFIDGSGNLVKQFGVYRQNYSQGPFRWAIYSASSGGSLLAVSPNFNLPSADGQNEVFNLAG